MLFDSILHMDVVRFDSTARIGLGDTTYTENLKFLITYSLSMSLTPSHSRQLILWFVVS
jgi:hypothetical protein